LQQTSQQSPSKYKVYISQYVHMSSGITYVNSHYYLFIPINW